MKILIDGRPLVNRPTGIGTYTIDAIIAICKYKPEWDLILALPKPLHKEVEGLPLDKINIIIDPLPLIYSRFLWMQFKLPLIARRVKPDVLWSTNQSLPLLKLGSYKYMATIHDVVWKELRNTTEHRLQQEIWTWFLDYSVKAADYLWYNSHYTKSMVEHYFPILMSKRNLIGISCNGRFKRIEDKDVLRANIFRKYNISRGFILFVGTLEPRKNLSFLLKIMPQIYKNTGYQLIVAGARGWHNDSIRTIVQNNGFNKDCVRFTDFISNEELVVLYNCAILYVSTSLNEGFGLPQLEAMSCGCPVISPHNSAMIEVVCGRGQTIEGWEPEVWIESISNLLNNENDLKKLSNPDLSEYSWKKIIDSLNECINKS